MAVEGIANIIQSVEDPLFGRTQVTQAGTKTLGTGSAGNAAVTEDTFTPSTQNNPAQATAQDAGIFQVSQGALTAVAASILFARTIPNVNQSGAPAQPTPATETDAGNAQTAAPANPNTSVNAAQQVAATPAVPATTGAAATANVQVQIQALNAALPALGLSNAEIQQIDRIASLIQNFNPAAYINLVNQFEALAQQSAANAEASAITTATTNAGANANGGGFQVRGISGLQETASNAETNGGGQSTPANNIQSKAAGLQIEQSQFTLANGNGQTTQVQAPQQNNVAVSTNQPTA
jgi:hypothetical protein